MLNNSMTNETKVNKECKVVFTALVAKSLLRKGYQIVDIKAKKGAPNETVFVFKVEGDFNKDLREITEELERIKQDRRNLTKETREYMK